MAYGAYSKQGYTMGADAQPTPDPAQANRFASMFEKALADLMKKQTMLKDSTAQDAAGRFMFGPQMRAGE